MQSIEYFVKWKKAHRDYWKKYYRKNKEIILNRQLQRQARLRNNMMGWEKTFSSLITRKTNPYYIKREIKNYLTLKDVKYLWERDNAEKLIKPVLHRINNNSDYTINNCKYMERGEHLKLPYLK